MQTKKESFITIDTAITYSIIAFILLLYRLALKDFALIST
jgi:hypothetical protein